MKYIKKSMKIISMFLTGLILFLNCTKYTNDFDNPLLQKMTGEEIFKSIFLMDGDLTKNINALSRYSVVDKLSNEDLIQYRQDGEDLINFLRSTNKNFFLDFQNKLYSQDPVLIKETLLQVTKDIEPWLVEKLDENNIKINEQANLSKEAINIIENGFSDKSDFQDDYDNLQKELSKNYSYEMNQKCGIAIAIIGIIIVAAVAVVVYLWAWVWTPDSKKSFTNKERITKDVISIQIAENLRLN